MISTTKAFYFFYLLIYEFNLLLFDPQNIAKLIFHLMHLPFNNSSFIIYLNVLNALFI